ncbi:MAG: thioredoxin family protein [Actinomycetota bacterium]|nr:thioredoxin family protein [Actinomycetota bacterium]
MNPRLSLGTSAVAIVLGLAACGGGSSEPTASKGSAAASFEQPFTDVDAYPVFASSEIVKGPNRFLIGLLNDEDAPIASPEISMHVAFFDLDESADRPEFETEAGFLDSGPRGLYVTYPTFDSTGRWGAEVTVSGPGLEETVRAGFDVAAEPVTPAIGEKVPPSQTPTSEDAPLREITTDDAPDPRFYETSVGEALAAGEPFVVTFATPKFCTSAVCAPTLDIVKKVSQDWPAVTFIHVEVYENLDDPSNLEPVPAIRQWGLPSEPWVFVVDGRGRVAAKFEGTLSPAELDEALAEV